MAGELNRVAAGNATNFVTGINLLSYKGFSGSKEDHFPFRKPTVVLEQISNVSIQEINQEMRIQFSIITPAINVFPKPVGNEIREFSKSESRTMLS